MADMEGKPEIPLLMARRTLLIGLGTSGAAACNLIMDRMRWEFDKLDNIPWVKCLVLETAELEERHKMLRQYAQLVPLKVTRNQYADLISNPETYQPKMGFVTWDIPDRTRSGDAVRDSIENGANNIRILGRIALLYPDNFLRVVREIKKALDELGELTHEKATEAFNRTGERVDVRFADAANEKLMHVYVVGSLCGGTSSGSFIDLGYLLQKLQGYSGIRSTGLFLLPSSKHSNEKHNANVCSSLTELNHYSSPRSRYRQQFPDRYDVTEATPNTRPYDHLYLLQARGATNKEYAQLITAAADYIYSDVAGGTADVRDGKRADVRDYFDEADLWGGSQKFMTFGMSSIEFPYIKVLKACTLRLTGRGLKRILRAPAPTPALMEERLRNLRQLRLTNQIENLLQRTDSGNVNLLGQVQQVLNGAANAEDPKELENVRGYAAAAFSADENLAQGSDLPRNIVPITVESNKPRVLKDLIAELEQAVQGYLDGSPASSVPALAAFLKAAEAQLTRNLTDCEKLAADETEAHKASEAYLIAKECATDPFLAITMGKKRAVRRYAKECTAARMTYFVSRLRAACKETVKEINRAALDRVKLLEQRVSNPATGLRAELEMLERRMEAEEALLDSPGGTAYDGSMRVINGVELFEAGKTISEEYGRCINPAHEDELSRRTLQESLLPQMTALLLKPDNPKTRFDPDPHRTLADADLLMLLETARPARKYFDGLKTFTIVDRLLARSNELPAWLTEIKNAGRYFLETAEQPRYRDADNKKYEFIFFKNDLPNADQLQNAFDEAHLLEGRNCRVTKINDTQSITMLKEWGAFSLGCLKDLKEEDSKWNSDFRSPDSPDPRSRGDVQHWITWKKQDSDEADRIRDDYLVGIAVGLIQSSSATRYVFRYPAKEPGQPNMASATLSNDLWEAVEKIKDLRIAADLANQIKDIRRKNGATDMFDRIKDFIAKVAVRPLLDEEDDEPKDTNAVPTAVLHFREGDQEIYQDTIRAILIDYCRKDKELEKEFSEVYKQQHELKYAVEQSDGSIIYICDKCHANMGSRARDLYPRLKVNGRVQRTFACPSCHKPL